ncbi:VP29 [Thermus phage P23-77]|uniref:VP29 n=1 Tax=Thermus virus P23-77 TaxID=1714272 RepID=C8CHM7_9VIRU|nr:virion structural protein [Thermus phage P23-77]ACV05056.1 VP29 [Thermus phage P23-77]
MGRIILVRPLLPPPPQLTARLQPQYLHWQVGRYRERLTSGPGGLGRGKVWVVDKEGEQHNLILTQTYDSLIPLYGFLDMLRYAAVGTGSTPPDPSQTGLANEVRRTLNLATGYSYYYIPTRIADGVADILAAREFTEAEVGGLNLTEWGFGPRAASGTGSNPRLAVRELFRDGSGNPIVLTLATDQRLRLLYKMRLTVGPVTPQAVSINISGIGVRTGKLVMRKYIPTSADPFTRWREPQSSGPSYYADFGDIATLDGFARQTAFGVTGGHIIHVVSGTNPSTYYNNTTAFTSNLYKAIAYQSYVANSRQRKSQPVVWLSSEANTTIYGIGIGYNWYPSPLLIFDPGQEFAKSNLYKLQIDEWTLTWGP